MMMLSLPSRLDLIEAKPLTTAFQQATGQPVTVDASAVEHLGGLCLQILISAARAWRAQDLAFAITPRSEAFDTALGDFGLSPQATALEEL